MKWPRGKGYSLNSLAFSGHEAVMLGRITHQRQIYGVMDTIAPKFFIRSLCCLKYQVPPDIDIGSFVKMVI